MMRLILCAVLALSLSAAALAADVQVVFNGRVVTVPVVTVDGKIYVDPVALAALFGGKASYDAGTGKLYINPAGGAAAAANTGTPQMAGDNGALNQVYSLSKATPTYFRLVSAEFTASQVVIGNKLYAPTEDEKLLLLHFTVQNPDKVRELLARNDCLRITAYDDKNIGYLAEKGWGDDANKQWVAMNLKPAQTVTCYACVRVPAKGPIVKLMIQPRADNDGPVLRYMFTDQIKPLGPPFADPNDATGATALSTVPAAVGTAYPFTSFTITLEGLECSTDAMGTVKPPPGGSFLIAKLLVQNTAPLDSNLRYDFLRPVLATADGQQPFRYRGLVSATSSTAIAQMLKPGTEAHVRLWFDLPAGQQPAKLTLQEGAHSRSYEWQVPVPEGQQ